MSANTAETSRNPAVPPRSEGADLELKGITKRFAEFIAVKDLDLTVPSGTFFCVIGTVGLW